MKLKESLAQAVGYTPIIHAEQAKRLCEHYELEIESLLIHLLSVTKARSLMPLSGFKVGAAALGKSGNIYLGASYDFRSISTAQCIHAEQAAISIAHTYQEKQITRLATSTTPCGFCRQFLVEIGNPKNLKILTEHHEPTTLDKLLPEHFGPEHLSIQQSFFGRKPNEKIKLDTSSDDELILAALKAAQQSYSPYWSSFAGVALQTRSGQIFPGSYLENAAQNPGVPPMQAALVNLFLSGKHQRALDRAVLVEAEDAGVRHWEIAKSLLQSLNAKVKFEFHPLQSCHLL